MNRKAANLDRYPRTKLMDLREQSECLVVTLSLSPEEQRNTGPRARGEETSTPTTAATAAGCYSNPSHSSSSYWFDNNNHGSRANYSSKDTQQTPGMYRADGVAGADVNNICAPIADGGGSASFVRRVLPREEEEKYQVPPAVPAAAATVCVVGTRAAVDSAGVLLGVILDYMRRERETREGGVAARERLLVSEAPLPFENWTTDCVVICCVLFFFIYGHS